MSAADMQMREPVGGGARVDDLLTLPVDGEKKKKKKRGSQTKRQR